MLLIATVILSTQPPAVPTIVIDRDNFEITQSCRVRIVPQPIIDGDGNGVIHIATDDITVEFVEDLPPLHGAKVEQRPDSFTGTGIVITSKNVTLSGAKVSGFKVGIHAKNADGLTIHHCDVSGNFAQHLKSTPQAEDGGDWLWPHNNDNNEWITNYGAGLCIEDSKNVTVHDIRARRTQNGIILDSVNDSKVYDCDCSFLSGWGLAMWRSSRNMISRNAFDFCIRGYSHGVYNRGQDSAGILMFEQCCDNVIAENSCTHGGDGLFGFAGKEALGEVNPREDREWYKRRGNNGNLILVNDFSFAAAHGLEMTFSFGNYIWNNRFLGNAICGIWGGYSSDSSIAYNRFESNGDMAYGLERGGINIEHGQRNLITANHFSGNKCGIHLWSDDDAALAKMPWAAVNGVQSYENRLIFNQLDGNETGIHLRETGSTLIEPMRADAAPPMLDADAASRAAAEFVPEFRGGLHATPPANANDPRLEPLGITNPLDARALLAGRESIIMTEWGPWDHESPLLQFVQRFDHADRYRLLGAPHDPVITVKGDVAFVRELDTIRILPNAIDTLLPYELIVETGDSAPPLTARGVLTGGAWTVKTFASAVDPRQDVDTWRKAATNASAHTLTCDPLDLPFGNGGMTEVRGLPVRLPRDHFGVIATRTLKFPKGRWRIDTTSDDGIRVWLDDKVIIDDWTWHIPTKHSYEFEVAESREIRMRVEYFELDGLAALQLQIAPQH